MPSTEIDAIFASKVKPTQANVAPSSEAKGKVKAVATRDPDEVGEKKLKKKKKKSRKDTETVDISSSLQEDITSSSVTTAKRKRPEPETIVDPSSLVAPLPKKKKAVRLTGNEEMTGTLAKKKPTDKDIDEKFRDSRGTGPRRQTEDGFSIYKEDELGIGDEGGDTPLCPFDCDCCF